MHTASSRPTKNDSTGISCIVPFASHVDQTEHDLDVVVTKVLLISVGSHQENVLPSSSRNARIPTTRTSCMSTTTDHSTIV
ncbi:hypothetical protein BDZ89DRAFT_1223057 [Hymenopellis radicata]|nr:hypothetical protein BDZ89DRAFT_1223057 [Hymenopellis radicata]